jgi:hypothetical protein
MSAPRKSVLRDSGFVTRDSEKGEEEKRKSARVKRCKSEEESVDGCVYQRGPWLTLNLNPHPADLKFGHYTRKQTQERRPFAAQGKQKCLRHKDQERWWR